MASRVGANLPAVGGFNQAVILDAIRRAPEGISRVELAARTGLSAQTVTNVSRRLLAGGVVREAGTVVAGVGKPRTLLQLCPDGRFAVGVHLDPSVVSIVLLDLAGELLDHRVLDVDPASTAQHTLDEIAIETRAIIGAGRVLCERMLGVGIATPGPLLEESGTVLNPPLLPQWERIPVRDLLSDRVELPVLLEKDVTAAAVAEQWVADGNRENFAFVYYGTGIGFGLVLQNEVIRGASGNAGDIGGFAVGHTDASGRSRPFGESVSPTAVVPRALAAGIRLATPAQRTGGFHLLDEFTALVHAAESGEPQASVIVDQVIADLANSLVPVANLLDVDRFVFGGPFWAPLAGRALERLPRAFAQSPYLVGAHDVVFEESAVAADVAAIGAACLVLDHALSPRPARMLLAHRVTV
ncbi:ROK family transcriptional regulator [Gryllotalpicola daejeonensis]